VRLIATILVTVLLAWFIASSLWIYPHSLAYFNEAIGGPLNGSNHLLGSNLDWGQDLRYLLRKLNNHVKPQVSSVGYQGAFDISSVTKASRLAIPASSFESQIKIARAKGKPVWIATTVNVIHGQPGLVRGGISRQELHGIITPTDSGMNCGCGYSICCYEFRDSLQPAW
jgi:hypothetical protein